MFYDHNVTILYYLCKEPHSVLSWQYGKYVTVVLKKEDHLLKIVDHKMENLFYNTDFFMTLEKGGVWATVTVKYGKFETVALEKNIYQNCWL